MSSGELKLYLSNLEKFQAHYNSNKDSLLSKIIGVFTVKTKYMEKVYIMLMENCMQFHEPEDLRFIFDLKGSRVDRKVKGSTKPTTTLKDENYRMINEMKIKKQNILNR